MDFGFDEATLDLQGRLTAFMEECVYPGEGRFREEAHTAEDPWSTPPVLEELKAEGRRRGLWNLFLPRTHEHGAGLTNLQYAPLAEIMGRNPWIAPEAFNCSAPDTGNMELLALFGTDEQKRRWLDPLLEGEIRSAFSMTEPEVASSDATNIATRIERDGDDYVINGRKWWISGAADPRCALMIVMGKTDPKASTYQQQSMVLVPMDTSGVTVVRPLPVFGYQDQHGHCEITFDNVRVPATNLIGEEGSGFFIAQARLGPGRIHHCMRAIGTAERALDLACQRAVSRVAFGKKLAQQATVQADIAESRMAIEQVRLLVLKTAWLIDTAGVQNARTEVAAIKVIAPRVALDVLDKAIQIHGGAGVSDDTPLAALWAGTRTLRLADGPDAVHIRSVARAELGPYLSATQ